MIDSSWQNATGHFIDFAAIVDHVLLHQKKRGSIYIGTDSHENGSNFIIVTAICLHGADSQIGGYYYYSKEVTQRASRKPVRRKIELETHRSIDIACALRDKNVNNITIHIDASHHTTLHMSGKFSKGMVSYVKNMGFICEIKPKAWASGSIADKHSK